MLVKKTSMGREFYTFDGCGINGADQYRTRLASLSEAGILENCGPMLAAAPELMTLLQDIDSRLERWRNDGIAAGPNGQDADFDQIRAKISELLTRVGGAQ